MRHSSTWLCGLFSFFISVPMGNRAYGQNPLNVVDKDAKHQELEPIEVARSLSQAFADVAQAVAPATVHIQVGSSPGLSTGMQQLLQDFELPSPRASGAGGSTGSGVIVREDGLVLTNHHVVGGSSDIRVTLNDRREYSARLIGTDPRTDIAVLQINDPGPFTAASLANSDEVRVGQWVIAIGHPFDFEFFRQRWGHQCARSQKFESRRNSGLPADGCRRQSRFIRRTTIRFERRSSGSQHRDFQSGRQCDTRGHRLCHSVEHGLENCEGIDRNRPCLTRCHRCSISRS